MSLLHVVSVPSPLTDFYLFQDEIPNVEKGPSWFRTGEAKSCNHSVIALEGWDDVFFVSHETGPREPVRSCCPKSAQQNSVDNV